MSDQKAGTGAHTEATRDPGQPLGTAALGRERLVALAPDGSPRPLASHRLELGPEADRWPISLSVVRRVIESGLAVLASDIRGDASFKGASSVHRFRIRSVLAVPLGPRPVRGVLYLDTQAAERAFSAEDLDFATAQGLPLREPVLRHAEPVVHGPRARPRPGAERRLRPD